MTEQPANGRLLGWLYGASLLEQQVRQRHPDEAVIFTSGAMLIHKTTADDTLQRVTSNARRGAFAATASRMVFSTSPFMPLNVVFAVITVGSVWLWFNGGELPAAMLAAFGVAWLVRRRPYRLELPLADVRAVTLKAVEGATGGYHTLIVHTAGASYQVVATDVIGPEARTFFLTLADNTED